MVRSHALRLNAVRSEPFHPRASQRAVNSLSSGLPAGFRVQSDSVCRCQLSGRPESIVLVDAFLAASEWRFAAGPETQMRCRDRALSMGVPPGGDERRCG